MLRSLSVTLLSDTKMNRIAVATDFSTRSDRALRRGTLMARSFGASLTLLHAVDDDQPRRVVETETRLAAEILGDQARTLREIDGLSCTFRVALGDPFDAVTNAAAEAGSDLVILGPHRRQALRDIFLGTTAERIIQRATMTVVMANGLPAAPYRHALLAVDFSPGSADAVRTFRQLGMDQQVATSLIHVYDLPGAGLIAGTAATEAERRAASGAAEQRAEADLCAFARMTGIEPVHRAAVRNTGAVAHTIHDTAEALGADLIVLGTRGARNVARFLLGSVTAEILRIARMDVMAVPPSRSPPAEQAEQGTVRSD